MRSKIVKVSGTEFKVGKNVLVRDVKTSNQTRWRQKGNMVQLKDSVKETLIVNYDIVKPVAEAEYRLL
jgi:hypothetical protein